MAPEGGVVTAGMCRSPGPYHWRTRLGPTILAATSRGAYRSLPDDLDCRLS